MPGRSRIRISTLIAAATAIAACSSIALAQGDPAAGWPKQPIRYLVPFGPGGSNDIIARIIAVKLAERLGQPVLVDNRAGGSGVIAAEAVARAAPDGYTILSAPTSIMVHNSVLLASMPYDPLKSFAPVTMVAKYPFYLAVRSELPVKSVKELVAHAKANPKDANYSGTSGVFQLVTELFKMKTGTAFEYIPYKSSGEMATSLMTGQTMMAFMDPAPMMSHYRAGKIRVLGVTAAKRTSDIPEAPTMAEEGVEGMEAEAFASIVAPAGTPSAIIKRLHTEITTIVKLPDVQDRFNQLAATPYSNTPEEFAAFVAKEIPRWKDVAQKANIKAQ